DVGRGLVVDPAQAQVGDRPRRGRDRGPSPLGVHARMGRAPVEAHLHRLRVRRAEDDLADRRRLVVDVPEPRREPRVVEGRGAEQADLLLRREDELETGMRPALPELAQVERDAVGDLALLARRARERGEIREQLDDVGHRAILLRARPKARVQHTLSSALPRGVEWWMMYPRMGSDDMLEQSPFLGAGEQAQGSD